jgi:hypothetical protein
VNCSVCDSDPCVHPGFCASCRKADRDRRQGRPPTQTGARWWTIAEADPKTIARCGRLLDPSISLDRACAEFNTRDRCSDAPESTYQAALYELRTYGLAQLRNPNCQRRLSDLSVAQIRELAAALGRLKPTYPAVTDELIAIVQGQLP